VKQHIKRIRKISIWVFIIPFVALNACLILITNFHQFFDQKDVILNTIPYIDGGASISRTARVFPTYLIFKPAMFLTAYLLFHYWKSNYLLQKNINSKLNYKKFFFFFGVGSALLLVVHSIFLGIKFDNNLYKLFRRVIILSFIIFELAAQAYLVINLYKVRKSIKKFTNDHILKIKIFLVSTLIIIAVISLPIVSLPGNKVFKHALEWDYFVGVIFFYFLTHLYWKKKR